MNPAQQQFSLNRGPSKTNLTRRAAILALMLPTIGMLGAKAASPFQAAKLAEMDAAITQAISGKRLSGAVLWFERRGQSYQRAYGHRALPPKPSQ